MTALIDVVFILLMFFMLTSSFNEWRAVDINGAVAAPTETPSHKPQMLILSADKSVVLHGSSFSVTDFSTLTKAQLGAFDVTKPLVVIPKARASVRVIVELLSQLSALGFTQVTLGDTLPEDPRPS